MDATTVTPTLRNTTRDEAARGDGSAGQLREQAAIVGKDVRELAETAGNVAREQVDPLKQYIREKPIKSVLIAAGAGILFNFFFMRRR